MTLSAEQLESIRNGEPVRVVLPELGEEIVLLRAAAFDELSELRRDEQDKQAWAKLGIEAASRWAEENPY